MKQRIVIVTGGFDPLHSGHLEYFKCAKTLGDVLIVGLNSDEWLSRKKGKSFLPYYEREQVLLNLKAVDNVINFDDEDDSVIVKREDDGEEYVVDWDSLFQDD